MSGHPGFAAAKAAIRTRFDAAWRVGGQPRTPVHWPGVSGWQAPAGLPWVRLSVLFGEGRRISIGPRLDRWVGQVIVQVFTPEGRGDGPLDALCDAAAAVFPPGLHLAAEGRLSFGTPTLRGLPRDGLWLAANVICPFQRDRTN